MNEFSESEEKIVRVLKTVFDPEIPVDIYELGLIYNIELNDGDVVIEMTLTAPNCPAADFILENVKQKVDGTEALKNAERTPVLEPRWCTERLSRAS